MENSPDFRIIYVYTDSYENAKQISRILVSETLAACCSIVQNMLSVYEWEGKIEENIEFLLIIKSREDKLEHIEKRINELHGYDVPEIISLPVNSMSGPYMNWMNEVLG